MSKGKIACLQCSAVNRVEFGRLKDQPKCGRCHQPLFQGGSAALDSAEFERQLLYNEIAFLVMFWAGWCGYCRKMRPAFEQAVRALEPFLCLADVSTDANPGLAARFSIASLPTLILFRSGREVARQAGALTLEQILVWARQEEAGSQGSKV